MTDETPETDAERATDEADPESAESSADADDAPSEETTGAGHATSEADTVPEELVERVRESDAETIAREISGLRARAEEAEARLDEADEEHADLRDQLKRKQADFQNFKKRMEKRQAEEQKRATEDLVTRIVDVRDNLKRGLDQEGDIREGVESTLRQFDDVLDAENVEEISPEPGDDVDPQRHEVLMRVDSERPEGTVAQVHRPGYEMAEKVIRAAQVTVSQGDGEQ
ncbi:nucleotide exchange factor GrpE [Halomarina oriensis]|uniref:Protein GrpE n=1 Tax=Halomarina oriensis TaxID=671145 RepID=A0A6B0GU21_9EURY|nr:nucleotide exchange factor GrpE [Halomarina oriensis]MWG35625.1 nucleotide exchange factor GrpE [Halomarina oriensis]